MENKLKQGPISENELMKGLLNAKKLMSKVDSGDYSKGHINEKLLMSDPEELVMEQQPQNRNISVPVNNQTSVERIQSSRLPDSIKEAMINKPITLNDNLNMSFMDGAKQLMEKEGLLGNKKRPEVKSFSSQRERPESKGFNTLDRSELKNIIEPIVENIVRKTLNEVLDDKLTQILTAQQTLSINENLLLKVGDSIFQGRITGVKNTKK